MTTTKTTTFSMPTEAIEKLNELSKKSNLKKSNIVAMLVLHSDLDTLTTIMTKEITNERKEII